MVPGSLAEWKILLPNLTAKLGGGAFSTSFFYLSSGIAGEQGPRGLPGVPGSVGPRGMSERLPQACREGPHLEEEVLGSPRVLLDLYIQICTGWPQSFLPKETSERQDSGL